MSKRCILPSLLILAVVVLAAPQAAHRARPVEARSFVLVDNSGERRAIFGYALDGRECEMLIKGTGAESRLRLGPAKLQIDGGRSRIHAFATGREGMLALTSGESGITMSQGASTCTIGISCSGRNLLIGYGAPMRNPFLRVEDASTHNQINASLLEMTPGFQIRQDGNVRLYP